MLVVLQCAGDIGFKLMTKLDERLSETELRTGQIDRRLARIAEDSKAIRAKPITRDETTRAIRDFDPAWKGLVPREQASLLALLNKSIVYDGAHGEVAITWRPSGIATLADDVANAGGSTGAGHGRGKAAAVDEMKATRARALGRARHERGKHHGAG